MGYRQERIIELLEEIRDAVVEESATSAEVDETPTPDGDKDGFNCGVNGCSRTVDDSDATCWQH